MKKVKGKGKGKRKRRSRHTTPYLCIIYVPQNNRLILQFYSKHFSFVDKWEVRDFHDIAQILRLLPSFNDREIARALRSLNKNHKYMHFYFNTPKVVIK